ncbi:hypothetical protein ACFWBC_37395 [Streptomyces sp. NPDC059985]|uniref:hypothetical protein n=1 Tax=Streptomyces sp. NPDC059985 TaxID=3347025 RepID=UPI00367FAF01
MLGDAPFGISVVPQYVNLSHEQMLRSLSFHEAGHAVVGMVVGINCARSSLFQDEIEGEFCWTGRTVWGKSEPSCFHFAAMCAAGQVAGLRQLEEAGLLSCEVRKWADAPHDRETAIHSLAGSGYEITLEGPAPANGATWSQVTMYAEALIGQYWNVVTEGAEALLGSPALSLSGDQIAQAVGIANPPRVT